MTEGGETMKAVLIKGIGMPEGEGTFIDVRINSDGSVLIPCGPGEIGECTAEEINCEE